MEFEELQLNGVWLGKSPIHSDSRGWFREWFKPKEFKDKTGIFFETFQSNSSLSHKNVVRGLHFSNSLNGQAKLVTCLQGRVLDVVIDLRKESDTFLKSVQIELSSEHGHSLYIPSGFGHGFISLEDNTMVVYNLSSEFDTKCEYTLNIFDPQLNIGWTKEGAILSERDLFAPSLSDQISHLPH